MLCPRPRAKGRAVSPGPRERTERRVAQRRVDPYARMPANRPWFGERRIPDRRIEVTAFPPRELPDMGVEPVAKTEALREHLSESGHRPYLQECLDAIDKAKERRLCILERESAALLAERDRLRAALQECLDAIDKVKEFLASTAPQPQSVNYSALAEGTNRNQVGEG